jgi:UDP-N-acetylglucosamine acyltransferase
MIHKSSEVHPEAQIDSSVEIGPFCVIGKNVKIGKNTRLLSHVILDGHTEIGDNNVIHPFAVLGNVPQDLKYKGEPTRLVIGNQNTIREGVTMNTGTVQGGGVTKLGNHNLIMAYTHLGHDCTVGNHVILANAVALAGHVTIDDYANIGGMCGVSQFVRVGSYCYVGGQSGIEKDLPPFCIAVGSRNMHIKGANIVGMRRHGFSADSIQKINEAIKLWTRQDVQKEQCLLEIESQYAENTEIQKFIQFIRTSKQGVVKG